MPEGMLYPTQDNITLFESWLRVEMLDALRMMIEENLVRSLLPDMQLKLITDMLQVRPGVLGLCAQAGPAHHGARCLACPSVSAIVLLLACRAV